MLSFALLVGRQRLRLPIDRVRVVIVNAASENLGRFHSVLRVKTDPGIATTNLQLLQLQLHLLLLLRWPLLFSLLRAVRLGCRQSRYKLLAVSGLKYGIFPHDQTLLIIPDCIERLIIVAIWLPSADWQTDQVLSLNFLMAASTPISLSLNLLQMQLMLPRGLLLLRAVDDYTTGSVFRRGLLNFIFVIWVN